jgi:hypothetical protein
LREIYFFFFFPPPRNKKRNPTRIAHIAKAPRANAKTKVLSKSAILPTLPNRCYLSFFINRKNSFDIKRTINILAVANIYLSID